MANFIARLLSTVFQRSWELWEVLNDWKKAIFKESNEDPDHYRLLSLASGPRRVMEQVLQDVIFEHLKDKKVTENTQCGFIKDKLDLTNLNAFGDNMTGSVDKGRAKYNFYFDFSKAFNTVL